MASRSRQPHAARKTDERPAAPSPARRRLLRWTAGGGAALLGTLAAKGLAPARLEAQAPSSIVGSWLISFPEGGGATQDPNERQIISFTSDGIVLNASVPSQPVTPDQGPPGATRTYSTAGQGVWTETGVGQVRLTFFSVDYDDQGRFVDLVQVTSTLNIGEDQNSFLGNFGVQVTDAGGNVLFSQPEGSNTVQGTRITV